MAPSSARTSSGAGMVVLDLTSLFRLADGSTPVVPGPVRDAVGRVRDQGIRVVLVCDEPLVAALLVAEQLGLDEILVIASGGAITVRYPALGKGKAFDVELVHPIDANQPVATITGAFPGARIAAELPGVGIANARSRRYTPQSRTTCTRPGPAPRGREHPGQRSGEGSYFRGRGRRRARGCP